MATLAAPPENETYRPLIRDLPQGERPRERLKHYGSRYLSNTELIAILLRTGLQGENVLSMASRLLSTFNGLSGLGSSSFAPALRPKGFERGQGLPVTGRPGVGPPVCLPGPRGTSGHPVAPGRGQPVAPEMGSFEQEHLRVLLLNTKNEVVSLQEIYIGNVNSSVARPAEIFRPAVRDMPLR